MTDLVTVVDQDTHVLIAMDDGKANALGFDMFAALNAALDQAEAAGKCIVLAGRPGRFSAGFDLTVMARQDADTLRLLRSGADLALRLFDASVPVVGAVSGHAIAMGALLCLSVDYRVGAAGDFKLGLNEVEIGMTLPWFGVELARARLANEWIGRAVDLATLFDPERATQVGYLDEVVEAERLTDRAGEVAAAFARLNMTAFAETKARTREPARKALQHALERDFAMASAS